MVFLHTYLTSHFVFRIWKGLPMKKNKWALNTSHLRMSYLHSCGTIQAKYKDLRIDWIPSRQLWPVHICLLMLAYLLEGSMWVYWRCGVFRSSALWISEWRSLIEGMATSKHEGNVVRYIEITSLSLVFKGVSKLYLSGIPSSPADVRIYRNGHPFLPRGEVSVFG